MIHIFGHFVLALQFQQLILHNSQLILEYLLLSFQLHIEKLDPIF